MRGVYRTGTVKECATVDCDDAVMALAVTWDTDTWALQACERCTFARGSVKAAGVAVEVKIYSNPPFCTYGCLADGFTHIYLAHNPPAGVASGMRFRVLAPRTVVLSRAPASEAPVAPGCGARPQVRAAAFRWCAPPRGVQKRQHNAITRPALAAMFTWQGRKTRF